MRADEIQAGDIIDYRSEPAEVVYAWTSRDNAPSGIVEPVGIEIMLNGNRVRIVWPEISAVERMEYKNQIAQGLIAREDMLADIDSKLEADILARPVELWS